MSTPEYYAQKTLIKNNIKKLPIEADTIIGIIKNFGYNVKCIEDNKSDLKDVLTSINMYSKLKHKHGYTLSINGMKAVFYSKSLTMQQQTEVITHELGHIVLNHISNIGVLGYSESPELLSRQEKEANDFMREFLAPACIIKSKNYDFEGIKNNTLISDENAKIQHTQAYSRRKHTDTETKLINQFNGNKKRSILNKYLLLISANIALVVALSVFTYHFRQSNMNIPLPTIAPTQQISENINVYKSLYGKVYHKNKDCHYIKNKDNILTMTVTEAENIGLKPCSECFNDKGE